MKTGRIFEKNIPETHSARQRPDRHINTQTAGAFRQKMKNIA